LLVAVSCGLYLGYLDRVCLLIRLYVIRHPGAFFALYLLVLITDTGVLITYTGGVFADYPLVFADCMLLFADCMLVFADCMPVFDH
jgi:hypothetical protein